MSLKEEVMVSLEDALMCVQQIARRLGIELSRFAPETSSVARMQRLLSYHQINIVLDVGANKGQYASLLRKNGYRGLIVSFEPLSSAYADLMSNSKNDPLWKLGPRTAIGDKNGEIVIHISKNQLSSSVLEMGELHLSAAPDSRYIDTEIVPVSRLDTAALPYLSGSNSVYLKIDTQGFEKQVLNGAADILPGIKGVQLELSLTQMYKGETPFREMLDHMNALGYELHALIPGFTDATSGRLLQVDGVFFR
jgi:FkbM family methyltransferase